MPNKVYVISDYIVPDERTEVLDENKVYNWLVGEYGATGKISDFVEEFGTDRMYSVICKECGMLRNIAGSIIQNSGLVCQDCRKANIPDRVKRGTLPIKKSLLELVPEVAEYWSDENNVNPANIFESSKSQMKFWLFCKLCGREFSKSYESILSSGCTCRSCTRRLNVPKDKTLKYLYPEVAVWYDSVENILPSDTVSANSNFKYKFLCPSCGNVFEAKLNSVITRYQKGYTGCNVCSGNIVVRGYNDLSAKNEVAYRLWDYTKNDKSPYEVLYSDQNFYWFKCERGHSFKRTPFRILKSYNKGGQICPVCSGTKVIAGYNDVKTLNPWAYKYWDYEKNSDIPEEVYYHSEVKRWFKCDKGHSYLRCVSGMYRSYKNNTKGYGCTFCSGKSIESGVSDLKTLFPDIVANYWSYEYNEVDPITVHPYSGKYYWWLCTKCGMPFELDCDRRVRGLGLCEDCRTIKSVSAGEIEISNFIKKYCEDVKSQVNFGNYSYDIYIPSKRLVVEYNGIYYHSDAVSRYIDGNWNLKKYKELQNRGISLLVVWEDDWLNKNQVCQDIIKYKLGVSESIKINARSCNIVESGKSSGVLFWHHIQGDVSVGCRYVSLLFNDEVVAELAYRCDNSSICIVRYATSCIVRGGFSRLLNFLMKVCKDGGYAFIYTFSDNSISDGSLYKKTGFVKDCDISPDYMYVYNGRREHKFNFRKKRFQADSNLIYKEGASERELAAINGIHRVYDYGKVKWILNIDT